MREERGGAWALFVGDLRWSVRACQKSPLVPTLWVLIALLWTIDLGPVGVVLLPAAIFDVGLTGTVRLSFAELREGRPPMRWPEVWSATGSYLKRFMCLGFWITVLLLPFFGLGELLDRLVGGHYSLVLTTLAVAVLDVIGTFIPAALALSTWRVTEAARIGWRVLREGWSQHRWHALVPPLAVQVLAMTGLQEQPILVQLPVMLVAAIIGIIVRGATVAAYLRAMPVAHLGPSWLDGRPKDVAPR